MRFVWSVLRCEAAREEDSEPGEHDPEDREHDEQLGEGEAVLGSPQTLYASRHQTTRRVWAPASASASASSESAAAALRSSTAFCMSARASGIVKSC